MTTKARSAGFFRGRRMRVTRVDANGRYLIGDNNAAISTGMAVVNYTTNMEEGDAITSTNANGDLCINETPTPQFNGIGVEVEFCKVDFSVFEILTGQEVILDENGRIVGIDEATDVDLTAVNFALEVWPGATSDDVASVGSQGQFGYVLTPFLGGGVIGDYSIENDAITFTVTNMSTKNGSNWGSGPYAVELVGGVPAPLRVPLRNRSHRRTMIVEVAPPPSVNGWYPVLDPADADLTGILATPDGVNPLQVTFTPEPAGADPVIYDFGDGEWDYADAGTFEHTYETAGTYTVTATRGTSTVTESVVVG